VQLLNRFDEPIFTTVYPDLGPARRFARMLGANPRRFALIGLHRQDGAWVVCYRARRLSPWPPDARATWPAGGVK